MPDIRKLADLAMLDISEDDERKYAKQLESVLSYVQKLNELELPADAPMLAHVVRDPEPWREDVAEPVSEEDRQALIDAFPESTAGMNVVPAVFDRE